MIEETDTSGNEIRSYFFDGRRVAWRDAAGNVYYYFADASGSTRAVTDSSGNVCFSADYYPYGQENDYVTSCSPTYRFTGYEYDSETGNYYAYARYYNPRLGRFMSPDPLGGSVDDPQSLNRYSYVLNNSESLIDPLGLCVFSPQPDTYSTNSSGDPVVTGYSVCFAGVIQFYWNTPLSPPTFAYSPDSVLYHLPPHNPRPTRPKSPRATASRQGYRACMLNFQNSAVGGVVGFGSLLSFADDFWGTSKEWAVLGGAKYAGVEGLSWAEKSSAVTDYSITAGTATDAVPLVGPSILGTAGLYGVGAATAADAAARMGCSDPNPSGTASLASPILPFP